MRMMQIKLLEYIHDFALKDKEWHSAKPHSRAAGFTISGHGKQKLVCADDANVAAKLVHPLSGNNLV